jgi:hypothetical protein
MKKWTDDWTIRLCAVLALGLALAVGCSRGPSRVYPPSIDATAAGEKAVELYDADKDGKISGAELARCPGLKAALAKIDTDHQRSITAAKLTARIALWQESKIGSMTVNCTVLRNGLPLADAEVKFVPERFLGNNVQTATGKTDKNGLAIMKLSSAGQGDPAGVAPGLYRVEITQAGDQIPAKYNAETIFGQEVFFDSPGMPGPTYNLQY